LILCGSRNIYVAFAGCQCYFASGNLSQALLKGEEKTSQAKGNDKEGTSSWSPPEKEKRWKLEDSSMDNALGFNRNVPY
jgi:hypothetical protein